MEGDMREIILVGAPWCGVCKAMGGWFLSVDWPGVTLRYVDIEDPLEAERLTLEGVNVSSLPTVLFKEDRQIIQTITGAMSRHDLEGTIMSLWPDAFEGKLSFMTDLIVGGPSVSVDDLIYA
jgi:thiol-disulfide isomerase/thioredoxin